MILPGVRLDYQETAVDRLCRGAKILKPGVNHLVKISINDNQISYNFKIILMYLYILKVFKAIKSFKFVANP